MKIAFVGTRGVPASYSGFETFVEELGARLAASGHQVTVYCRSHHITYAGDSYRGMRLVKLPTITNKYLDTLVHSKLSMYHALYCVRPDVIYVCGQGNAVTLLLPRMAGTPTVINVDGPDWERQKWNRFARWFLKSSERVAVKLADIVIADSREVQRYYRSHYNADTTYIAYGADVPEQRPGTETLEKYGLKDREYFLFVGRLVPENCAHHLVEAFEHLQTDKKCVIVGDAPYAEEYKAHLKLTSNPNVVFTGYVFGDGYRELSSHAYVHCLTSEVGGTHPALVEAMAFGNCVVVNDIPTNLETIGEAGLSYSGKAGADSLRNVLQWTLEHHEEVQSLREKARARVLSEYSWEVITQRYEELFREMTGQH
ncbi:MAG: DUF1972 domain-containing protein [Armatimonadetes bacterium]|nr:DUF1972 domain-containing protein [Armatimonadota bacterium]